MRSFPGERSATLAKVLSDAERVAWGGEAARSWRLLRLAERLAPGDRIAELLTAAESVRSGLSSRGPDHPRLALTHPGMGGAVRVPRLLPVPDRGFERGPAETGHVVLPARAIGGRAPRTRRAQGATGRMAVGLLVVVLLSGFWPATRYSAARAVLASGHPCAAVRLLGGSHDAGGVLLRGEAKAACGDMAGAVADYVAAGSAGVRPGTIAWEAGVRLARVQGQDAAAADAFLEAYVAGIAPERWDAIASFLERAGRFSEADRVRRGVGRR